MNKIKLKAIGKQGSGKTLLLRRIQQLLEQYQHLNCYQSLDHELVVELKRKDLFDIQQKL